MQVENGISTKRSMVETAIKLENMEVRDIAFLDDHGLLVLQTPQGKHPSDSCTRAPTYNQQKPDLLF
jgi:hypothetical protein